MDGGAWWATVHGVTKESDVTERLTTLRPLGSDKSALLSSPHHCQHDWRPQCTWPGALSWSLQVTVSWPQESQGEVPTDLRICC